MTSPTHYGTRKDMSPPPGFSRWSYRNAWKQGKVPGTLLPGRGGVVVSVEEWNAWLKSKQGPPQDEMDPIELDIRRRFKCER